MAAERGGRRRARGRGGRTRTKEGQEAEGAEGGRRCEEEGGCGKADGGLLRNATIIMAVVVLCV